MDNNIGEQLRAITEAMEDKDFLSKATDEELVAYLFLVEKMKKKLEKLTKLEDK